MHIYKNLVLNVTEEKYAWNALEESLSFVSQLKKENFFLTVCKFFISSSKLGGFYPR